MGMFDRYIPDPPVICHSCGREVTYWQGYDGPCVMFVWKQGVISPTGQMVSEDVRLSGEQLKQWRLPSSFYIRPEQIYCKYCPESAIGKTENDIWTILDVKYLNRETKL